MRHHKLSGFIIISALSLTVNGYAMNSFFCSKTGNYINLGDTLNQVFTKCGPPATTQDIQAATSVPAQVTQWIYNYQNNAQSRLGHPVFQNSALIVNMVNNKVISILVNGQTTQSTNFCSANMPITIGDTNLYVRQLCNTPSQVQTVSQNIQQPVVTQTVWTYQQQQFMPPVKLTFANSVLTSME